MTSDEIRNKFVDFFKSKPRDHKEISSAPLIPPDDPTTLFTSSGMQQLIPYLTGESHPEGKRLVNSQPCLRLEDIDEVGDNRHTTFFEMLGNWSLGDYFKKEQLNWFWEFLTEELDLPKERLWVSVFEGTKNVPKDEESAEIWKKIGIPEERIHFYGVKENWWSRSGSPDKMPVGEIGGPDSEVFFEFTQVKHDPKFGKECHPNCECGRFLEIGNSVFIQYIKEKDGSLKELPQKNVDFGGGLERLVSAVNNDPDIFKIDVFKPIIEVLEKYFSVEYGNEREVDKMYRIAADHIRASVFLAHSGVQPDNKLHGYVLRRLLRRIATKTYLRDKSFDSKKYKFLVRAVIDSCPTFFREADQEEIEWEIGHEIRRFRKTVGRGIERLEKRISDKQKIDGKFLFDLYQTYGFPFEITIEVLKNKGIKISDDQEKKLKFKFDIEWNYHKAKSRTASAGMFKGGLADSSEETKRLHTVTHLLHTSLRKVLGDHIQQKGSNVTAERLRFDFSHPQKLTDEELEKVEKLINKQIEKDLPVTQESKTFKEATDEGALAFFGEKYEEKVKVYTIGDPGGKWFSKEVCGGPHVAHTGEIGRVKIFKQEKIGSGVMRVYAKTEAV